MAKQTVNIGSAPNDGTGSTLREGGDLINDNFNEIYTAIGDGTTITAGTFLTDSNSVVVTSKTISGSSNTLSDIANASLTNSTISFIDDTSTTQSISLGGSFRFIGGSGITTTIAGNTITFDTDGSIVTETSTDILTNKTISGSNNTLSNIGNSSLTNSSITLIDDTSTTDAVSLGESLRLTGGTGITSVVGSNEVTFNIDNTVATLTGSQELTNKTINASSNTISNIVNANLSGTAAISNANLANPNITLGADTISLGATQTTITNLNLDGTSSLSGTGTIDLTGAGSKARFNFSGFGSLPAAATYEGMFAYDTVGSIPYVADSGGWVRILDENSSVSAHADVNISGIADGHILKWSSAQARFNVVADTGGATDLTVSDDSSTQGTISLATDVLGFVGGTGISTTVNPGNKTITITNTGISLTYTNGTATGDGSTVAITIDSGRAVNDVLVSVNGFILTPTTDYTISGTTLTFVTAPAASAEINIRYLPLTGSATYTNGEFTGDGSTQGFTIDSGRSVEDVLVTVNGVVLVPSTDYSISGTTLTFTTAPVASAEISVRYLRLT